MARRYIIELTLYEEDTDAEGNVNLTLVGNRYPDHATDDKEGALQVFQSEAAELSHAFYGRLSQSSFSLRFPQEHQYGESIS